MSNAKPSPATVKKTVDSDEKRNERHRRDLTRVREEGYREGLDKGRAELLNWLQEKYIGSNAPDRGSAEGEAILQLAREAGKYFMSTRVV